MAVLENEQRGGTRPAAQGSADRCLAELVTPLTQPQMSPKVGHPVPKGSFGTNRGGQQQLHQVYRYILYINVRLFSIEILSALFLLLE